MCYTCVRECPARAIRIAEGQAEIIPERCIGCGNCVRVCSQAAKVIHRTKDVVTRLIEGSDKVSACVAPSFSAAFPGVEYKKIIGSIRALGFDYVHEVAFGADLVASAYNELLRENPGGSFIGTTCPALVNYIECYYKELVPYLAPIVSPMTAQTMVVRELCGEKVKVVFIGPCLAKKGEDRGESSRGDIDAVITFSEIKELMDERGIDPAESMPSDTDPPYPSLGALFPVAGGMLQAADIREDLVRGDVVSAEGRSTFIETIKEYSKGDMDVRLLEILCCDGCIMGSGMGCDTALFRRRATVSQYVRERIKKLDHQEWQRNMERFGALNLYRTYEADDQRLPNPTKEEIRAILADLGKVSLEDELNCGACGYETCVEHAVAIFKGLAENQMCLPNTIEQLNRAIDNLAVSNGELAKAQEALVQSEKLASMGQLAAGIAHELNNPLGIVLMYSHLLLEEGENGDSEDIKMITEQAERCKSIVSGLLHFARQNKVNRQPVDARDIIRRSLRSVAVPGNITVHVREELDDPIIDVDQDQIIQVLTNLITNGCAAMQEGGGLDIEICRVDHKVIFTIKDTGMGIPENNLKKIFEPFFTTKEIGKGTGLGLAVSHGIVKMHSGDIQVDSNADPAKGPTGTRFTVSLPVQIEGHL